MKPSPPRLSSFATLPGALSLAAALLAPACKKAEPPPAPPPVVAPAVPAVPAAPPGAVEGKVTVTVNEQGFVPEKIPAKAGKPLILAITRTTEKTCATEIIFAGQEGKTDLPLNKTIEVTYTPNKSGNVKFGCAMGMMIGGVLEVQD